MNPDANDSRVRIEAAADLDLEGEVLPAADPEPAPEPEPTPAQATERERVALAGLVAHVTASIFSLIATRRAEPHWELTPAEAIDVGDATATAVMHYFPWLRLGPALAAIAAWGVVILPRSLASQAIAEHRAAQPTAAPGPTAPPGSPPPPPSGPHAA